MKLTGLFKRGAACLCTAAILMGGVSAFALSPALPDEPAPAELSVTNAVSEAQLRSALSKLTVTYDSEAEGWRKTMEYGMTIRPIEEYHGEPVYKVVFIAPNEACLAEAKQLYEDQFIFCESRLGDTPSAIVNGELINRKFNKGTGIKAICDELGCSLADTIGFGDSDNDLQMTDVVGISVCMANGSDNLKKLCDRICPAVTEDGVARELKTLGLI